MRARKVMNNKGMQRRTLEHVKNSDGVTSSLTKQLAESLKLYVTA